MSTIFTGQFFTCNSDFGNAINFLNWKIFSVTSANSYEYKNQTFLGGPTILLWGNAPAVASAVALFDGFFEVDYY